MYSSWDIECDRHNFLSFWTIFCPFTPLTTRKIKILKKWKKYLEISSFYTSVPKIMILCYTIPEIRHVTDVIIFHFGYFCTYLEISSFYISVPKIMIIWCTVPEIWCATDGLTDRQTDRQMDGWTENVTYRGGSPT